MTHLICQLKNLILFMFPKRVEIIVILIALLVGSEFFGIIGAITAIPMTMVLTIILKKVLRYSN